MGPIRRAELVAFLADSQFFMAAMPGSGGIELQIVWPRAEGIQQGRAHPIGVAYEADFHYSPRSQFSGFLEIPVEIEDGRSGIAHIVPLPSHVHA
jgi:hypothetical protein